MYSLAAISRTTPPPMHGQREATMGLAGMSLASRAQSSSSESGGHKLAYRLLPHTANGRLHQGHHSPCVKSASAELFPDLHTMSAPSGEERMLTCAAAQVEPSNALDVAAAALTVARTRVVWPYHCHGASWSHHSLRAARERLHLRSR